MVYIHCFSFDRALVSPEELVLFWFLPLPAMFSGSFYALLAGFLSAAASLSAKLSLGADYLREMCESRMDRWTETDGGTTACDWLHIPLRLLCGGLLFACNAVMWTFFSKALRHCSSSARVTVTTTASNFISSAFLGRVIFGETHAALWWVGMSLTLCGLLVLHASTSQTHTQGEARKDK
ncbi:transmembrane protein 42-like [Toxotes jaculatrix]|uniref:transmembrane protein 42-like n=1 Tax=Toxotes jaculatrix TaxID=941984 RepID=UPI001B3ABDB8|nr:transmembrane protein 42-like [Toxotes jaculatrix]XP_040900455.1 transmembrane protein 42-like [Toxotes jaculatrix]XP_040900456.1 transmembrane protein 42-like [Toxotes jaculatrix]